MPRFLSVLCLALALIPCTRAADRASVPGEAPLRNPLPLSNGWRTAMDTADQNRFAGFEKAGFDDSTWDRVAVPHNWDKYEGSRQLRHGNLHGYAWYRNSFSVPAGLEGKRVFLFFEGVGSYATVWVNGRPAGKHAGGLTTFTLDVTDLIHPGKDNLLAVRADHPAGIRDLPWICGGCERAYGFSEGPQPFGIIRPVNLVITADTRIEPFGVHAWIDGPQSTDVSTRVRTELKNYSATTRRVTLATHLLDRSDKTVAEVHTEQTLKPGEAVTVDQTLPTLNNPQLWAPAHPYLYTIASELIVDGRSVDRTQTPFGFRWISWPKTTNPDRRRLLVNGEPFLINGEADYEHQLGNNFAFTKAQIDARVRQIESAGFNTFRDAHHPHNLRFQRYWDSDGLLWWTQFGAHAWFDSEAFRTNFKTLLREWVKERRNSPSLILWGLQNESQLPTAFAQECVAIIREMDPTASTQRLVTTCNGGTGTDWDIPQNWSGTYSGDPAKYDEDLRTNSLYGEYGAWRSIDFHSEVGYDPARKILSEERFCTLMEMKIGLAEKTKGEACGHLHWPFTSHANPGRNFDENGEQLYDGIRPLDRVGPANNKGLYTIWGEPTDGYYLYRANFAPKETQPMAYIVSHTWPDRWTTPGRKSGIAVYSNCDEVELFNGDRSLGRRSQRGRGTHFQWDDVEIDCNLLRAEARVAGKVVANDIIRLHHLPAPQSEKSANPRPAPETGRTYLYRINCGGPEYVDSAGNTWLADRDYTQGDAWGSLSWAAGCENLAPAFASQRKIHDPVAGTDDEALYQTFRYGREALRYRFDIPNGKYDVELHFIEPWYGTGGGLDCTGWRLFDVAVNGNPVLRNLDLWREAGRARAFRKTVPARVENGLLEISFPRVNAGQAVISAIAISSRSPVASPVLPAAPVVIKTAPAGTQVRSHLDTGEAQYSDAAGAFSAIPHALLEADWIRTAAASAADDDATIAFNIGADSEVFVAHDNRISAKPDWLAGWERTALKIRSNAAPDTEFTLYRKPFDSGSTIVTGQNGGGGSMYTVIVRRSLPPSAPQFVKLAPGAAGWTAVGHAQMGARLGSGGLSVSRFPENLSDGDLLAPATAGSTLSFTALDHIEVVGAFPKGSPITGEWLDAKRTSATSDGTVYAMRRQRFAAGTAVSLSASDMPAYAIVRGVRPSATYNAETLASGGAQWTIQVGVGDRYGLNFRYRNTSPETINATLAIVQPDGSVLRTDPVEFAPTGSTNGWSTCRTRTGESINAGTYTLQLNGPLPAGLSLGTLEVE